MRVVTALAVLVVNVGIGWALAGPASANEGDPPSISQCYTVTVNPPSDVHPSVTVCQP